MSRDFVAEAGSAIVRMKADTRKRQLYTAIGGVLGTLTVLYGCGGLGLAVMAATVVGLLWLEIHGTQLEDALESVGSDEGRTFFVSSRDGLFIATTGVVFVERLRKFFPYGGKRRTVNGVRYDDSAHQLLFAISVRHPAMGNKEAAVKEEQLAVACPRSMSREEAQRVAQQVSDWAMSAVEQTLP